MTKLLQHKNNQQKINIHGNTLITQDLILIPIYLFVANNISCNDSISTNNLACLGLPYTDVSDSGSNFMPSQFETQ